jgi:hypothetical protein
MKGKESSLASMPSFSFDGEAIEAGGKLFFRWRSHRIPPKSSPSKLKKKLCLVY